MRKWINIITEAYDNTFRFKLPTGIKDIDVFRNPSKQELNRIIADAEWHSARGLITTGGDLLVWDTSHATHSDMLEHYPDAETNTWLYLTPKDFTLNDLNYMYNEGDGPDEYKYRYVLRYAIDLIKSCKALRRLYGNKVDMPVGCDNETGDNIIMSPDWIEQNVLPEHLKGF